MSAPNESRGRTLAGIELALRQRYTERRRVAQPSFALGSKHDAAFLKAAEVVLALKADPSQYVDAIFNSHAGEFPPTPLSLASPTSIKKYEETAEEERCPPKLEVETQRIYLTNYIRRAGLSKDEALLARYTTFRSYFRVLFCSETVRCEAMRMYGKTALSQIENDSSLKTYLQNKYPNQLNDFLNPPVYTIPLADEPEELPEAADIGESWESRSEVPRCL